jgi:hypothetical protein
MIRSRLACVALLSSSTALLAACTTDPEPAADPGTGTEAQDGGVVDDHGDHREVRVLDGGCKLEAFGPRAGTVVKSEPRAEAPGAAPWTAIAGGLFDDEQYAKASLAEATETEELRITDFGFKLPPGNVFMGVEVQLKRRAPEGGVVDGTIALVGVQNQVGRGKVMTTPWPSKIVGTHHYGQGTDTWGYDLNAPDVERPEFGVGLWVKKAEDASTPPTAMVDSIRVSVFYCAPPK